MKIGIFTDTYFPTVNGVTFTIDLWKRKLEERGYEIHVYYPAGKYSPGPNEHPLGSMEFRAYKDYRIAVPFVLAKTARDLDIVHIHGLFSLAIAGLGVSRKYGIPRMLTYHTPADEYMNYLTRNETVKKALLRVYNFWERQLLNSCEVVTCPSNVIRERLVSKGVKDVVVMSNGVDLDFFKPVDAADFRSRYGIGPGRVIGFCGRFGFEKHLEDLVGIADEFDGQILLAGRGPAENHYKRLAEKFQNVKFLGFLTRSELLQFYSCLDVFVFPSTAETQGLVALESMACGVPVVGANALALKDTIQDGLTGYLYESGNKKDLLEKIDKAFENRKILSANALEHVKEHSVDRSIDRLVALYKSLL